MRLMRQFAIIMAASLLGEIIRYCLPLPIPASVYGLLLLFGLLYFKVLQVEQVEKAAKFLIEIMPLMFIPAAVGLIKVSKELKELYLPLLLIVILTTVCVMLVAGHTTQSLMKRAQRKDSDSREKMVEDVA